MSRLSSVHSAWQKFSNLLTEPINKVVKFPALYLTCVGFKIVFKGQQFLE